MKSSILFMVFTVFVYPIYSQGVDATIKTLMVTSGWYELYVMWSYNSDAVFNDLSYDINYSGNNIEDGIKNFVDKHPFVYGTGGIPESHKEGAEVIANYWNRMKEVNLDIAYLILGWYILYKYELMEIMSADIDNKQIDPHLSYQLKSLMTDIKFRASMVTIDYNYRRQLLSLFDERTWYGVPDMP